MKHDPNSIHRKYGTDALRGIFDASPDNAVPAESSAVPLQENGIIAPATPLTPLVKTQRTFLSGFVPPDYIVDGLMKRGFLYSLTGATGAGKSAIALYLAAMVTHPSGGQKFGPHEVEQGRVVYIARENPDDIRMRLIGMASKLGVEPNELDYLVIDQVADILNEDLPKLIEEITRVGKVALVIVDTSAAVFTGNDENSNTEMGDHARCLRKLCSLPGKPTVLALCHPIKRPEFSRATATAWRRRLHRRG